MAYPSSQWRDFAQGSYLPIWWILPWIVASKEYAKVLVTLSSIRAQVLIHEGIAMGWAIMFRLKLHLQLMRIPPAIPNVQTNVLSYFFDSQARPIMILHPTRTGIFAKFAFIFVILSTATCSRYSVPYGFRPNGITRIPSQLFLTRKSFHGIMNFLTTCSMALDRRLPFCHS
jgi:hypothetical protein